MISGSSQKSQSDEKDPLPLYGPLEIQNYKIFLEDSKKLFYKRYRSIIHSDISIKDYEFIATLGRGAFGTVKLIKNKDGENYYAVKIQMKRKIVDFGSSHRVYLEKRVLCSIDFPFCVRMEHYSHDKEAVYFVMPFVSGGELFTIIRKFGFFHTNMVRFYAAQVVLALEYFQYIHFVYRDLKPENILVDHTGFLKITDFGLSKEVDSRTYTICGTPSYMAPEVVEGSGYGRSADWWSLGVLIYEMASGRPPFIANDTIKLFTKILYAPVPMYPFFSSDLKSLLRGLLNKDVSSRLGNLKNGAEDVKKHQWFKKVDWLQLLNRKVPPPYVPEVSGPSDTSNFPHASKEVQRSRHASDTVRKEVIDDKTSKMDKTSKRRDKFMSESFLDFLK